MKIIYTTLLFVLFTHIGYSQNCYWQQEIDYQMEIDMDVKANQFTGKQELKYTNNSPDTLSKVFYHLYFNAFQPNSMMDVRSRTIADPDRRVGNRIYNLSEDEIGYQKIDLLKQDGKKVSYEINGTILEVMLNEPIYPGQSSTFEMKFNAQIPLQVRRSGRDNDEGVRYSMTQWYPKMVEYDFQGWHANPYVGREFHGVWGSFDVKIKIDKNYLLGGTGYVQNGNEVGYGYQDDLNKEINHNEEKITWHFNAPMVHDFAWVADTAFTHTKVKLNNGTSLHFIYQADSSTIYWDSLPKYAVKIFELMNRNFGEYPYDQYTVAQGGDGGMEYPMITLITGERSKGSLIGVTAHEAVHSWYQHLLATNEAQYPWMDEGFTSFATDFVLDSIWDSFTPFAGSYRSYFSLVKSGKQEALTTHADHYETNRAYGVASYSMGLIFINQLGYIIGKETMMKGMRRYFNDWKYKHPTPNDFIRVMEKITSIELDWYLEQWTESTNTIDYGIKWMQEEGGKTKVILEKKGRMAMPLDVLITFNDGEEKWFNIPLRIMRGEKEAEANMSNFEVIADWPWTFPEYKLLIDKPMEEIKSIEIDPSMRMADTDRSNNSFPLDTSTTFNK